MSTNYTQNYALCQWEPEDKVLRQDFNADNAKLEAALTRIEATADAAKTASDAAYCPTLPPVAVGAYQGNGEKSREISLGFRPKGVLVLPASWYVYTGNVTMWYYAGMAVDGTTVMSYQNVRITNAGFQVRDESVTSQVALKTNESGMKYFYIAVR